MMKYFMIRSQLVVVSIVLFLTFGFMLALVIQHNHRWDFTKEKLYSISESTQEALKQLSMEPLEILAFYPSTDRPDDLYARSNFELFLKQCQIYHSKISYNFFDPDRMPTLAKEFHVKSLYTVILRYQDRLERLVGPSEESFTNALIKLAHPKKFNLCFVTGHDEPSIARDGRDGLKLIRESLIEQNYLVHEIILARDKIPSNCDVIVVAGPHRDLDTDEVRMLQMAFEEGRGILFLIDPMDPGTSSSYQKFFKHFSVVLGEDVIVDKMSRMVGGDFLIPLVNQYVVQHPITAKFDVATFFPVARSVNPDTEARPDLEVVPLAMTGSGSWSETNLKALEKGDAAFESETDISGPIAVALAVEKKIGPIPTGEKAPQGAANTLGPGRLVVIGDSDFMTNAYLGLSGNEEFVLNIFRWLTKDDRFISIFARQPEFKPLLLSNFKRFLVLGLVIGIYPLIFLIGGALRLVWRNRTA